MDYTIFDENNNKILVEADQARLKKEVAQLYKSTRKEMKLSQAELSARTGISQPNITRFESGTYNPSLDMMIRIAAGLGKQVHISIDDVICDNDANKK